MAEDYKVKQVKEVKREVKSEPKKVVNVQSENKGYTIDEMIHSDLRYYIQFWFVMMINTIYIPTHFL